MLSILNLFRIGIGPSSSHTVGPMRIARRFVVGLAEARKLDEVRRIAIELQGSLALTGVGHGSVDACVLGLMGWQPEAVDPDAVAALLASAGSGHIRLLRRHPIAFARARDITLACDIVPELHPNGMRLRAYGEGDKEIADETWYSTGGGFIASARQLSAPSADDLVTSPVRTAHPYSSGAELLALCESHGLDIAALVLANESAWQAEAETLAGIDRLVDAMLACIERGLAHDGILPGGLQVRRRAPELWRKLIASPTNETEVLLDRLNLFAMAVNEENAAGGRVVTAPTNGAAGIIPAVLRQYCHEGPQAREQARRFLLTAGGIGLLYKQRASISGAEMGCQGEVGVACSMAAAGLAAVWGGTPQQVAAAAEIGMEHNLGLTCDPVGGLVQIPCIERNAIGAVKAVNAARLALHSHEVPKVSLDQVIETMRQTGIDMSSKYKETSLGGLAVNVAAC
ncbi:L-serine dehydratase [Erythromicrobium ramosum]|uniref:L-serine dehydratase n=1 Tax=Erythrobacter ramosus TaxID=35811 RepID=A0A6I4UJ90_9SPHN|nr:L-serine ammonia-lyase [Erythrobacter ramosus]MBB3774977.1 L-serine dehydratase [Erythrobacter ramosus]MXP37383.1 L-serine ammonia-lyase [Erythrobacter ramosus]